MPKFAVAPAPALKVATPIDSHILTIKCYVPTFCPTSSWEGLMAQYNTDVIQGTLDVLILKTLSLAPLHGYGITKRIEQVSQDVFKVNPGSLLTSLRRLQRAGWLDATWRQTENSRRAKYYSLTRAGERRLAAETEDWWRRATAMGRLLEAEG